MLYRARFAALALVMLAAPCAAQLATGVNYNATTPAAPTGSRNVHWQNDAGRPTVNASAYVVYPTLQVACPSGSDLSGAVNTTLAAVSSTLGGIVDARACVNNFTWNTATTITKANTALLLPCGTLTVTQPLTVSPGVRNTVIRGCAYQGGSAASGTTGGTVWNWQGSGAAFIVGDPADASDTPGFVLTDLAVTTPGAGASAHGVDLHRVQEADVERVYFIGNNALDQVGLTLDGRGNYTGGTFASLHIASFGTALLLTGDGTGGANAGTFLRVHIDCPSSAGVPLTGGIGVSIVEGDGNTFTGGDIESCDTMLSLGAGATNNTFTGVRNENSNNQITAASGSQYNLWLTGGTMFTGKFTDSGTHNTFWDAFHRTFNNLNGDLWRSQADATVTNNVYTGVGLGHVRGRVEVWQTDVPGSPGNNQNAWQWGPGDGTAGSQLWSLNDLLNNVPRFGVTQLTTAGGNNQSFLNAAGTGNVCINCSAGSGTGGFVVASGGAGPAAVLTVDSSGDTYQTGLLAFQASGATQWQWECASASLCDLRNPAATVPADVFIAYENGGTEIDSQAAAAVVVNNHSYGGTGGFIVYEGGANYTVEAFGVTGSGAGYFAGNTQIGSASGTGNGVIGNHLNQLATADFAGHCTMTSATSCTISFQHSWSSIPACGVSAQFALAGRVYYTWAANVVTIHSTSTETGTFAAICAGDPN
jgi:hypothetical protein